MKINLIEYFQCLGLESNFHSYIFGKKKAELHYKLSLFPAMESEMKQVTVPRQQCLGCAPIDAVVFLEAQTPRAGRGLAGYIMWLLTQSRNLYSNPQSACTPLVELVASLGILFMV